MMERLRHICEMLIPFRDTRWMITERDVTATRHGFTVDGILLHECHLN
jgi:hypothetical protein